MRVQGWEHAEVRETHISIVLIGPDRVLKVKKPVNVGFLDFRPLEVRLAACQAEHDLNARTAPGVTLGVRALTASEDDDALEVDGDGPVMHYAVEMQRLPDERRMQSLLDTGALGETEVDRVASWLAAFHLESPVMWDKGGPEVVSRLVEENFAQLPEANALLGPDAAEEARSWLRNALSEERVTERQSAGWVRDGHGDLRLDHVYLLTLPRAPRIVAIDGVEFDETYRCLDVAADLAFLVMELTLRGRRELAERLTAQWALHTGDWHAYRVLDGYVAYRAWVRAKVRLLQDDVNAARQRLELAYRIAHEHPQRQPRLVAVAGPIASGKSTVAEQLSRALNAPVVDADRTRKQLAGVEPTARLGDEPFSGNYGQEATDQVYRMLAQRAEPVLESGRTLIVDASFRAPTLRAHLRRVAQRMGLPIRFVVCTAPRQVLRDRLLARDQDASVVSDARAPLLDGFLADYSAPSGPDVMTLDTSQPVDLPAVLEFIGARG